MTYQYENVKLEKGMYGQNGKSFLKVLESLDPSESYKGTALEGLDAFQHQLKRFDIHVKGAGSDMVEKFFHTSESSVLFPEFVSRVVRQGMESDILPDITATVTNFDGMDYRSIASVPTDDDKELKRVEEGASIPTTSIRTQENLVKLHKRGRMLVASYEAIRFQRLDLFSVTLRQIGAYIARMHLKDAIDVLMNGDGNGNAADSFVIGDGKIGGTKGELSYDALLGFWSQFDPYTMNTLLMGNDKLPTLLKWEFSYTGSVPCDSFTLRCAYEPAMAETLRRAVRFTAKEDGAVEFAGVVDECGVTCDEKGLQLEVSGRGMAALLLDNEAESVSYQWATMEEILKNHVAPYGIVCTGYDAVTAAARYRVTNGSSQWKALNDFAALHGGIAPYFDKTGALEIKRNRKASCVNIDEKTPVTALAYCDKRYGVIAEALVVDSKAGAKQRVKNEAFCDRGGTSRRVFYVPARSGRQMMRYTGEYQIAKSKEGAETLRVTVAGRFSAAPGDRAHVSGTKLGLAGEFRVIECVRRFGESGEMCEVTMQRE